MLLSKLFIGLPKPDLESFPSLSLVNLRTVRGLRPQRQRLLRLRSLRHGSRGLLRRGGLRHLGWRVKENNAPSLEPDDS